MNRKKQIWEQLASRPSRLMLALQMQHQNDLKQLDFPSCFFWNLARFLLFSQHFRRQTIFKLPSVDQPNLQTLVPLSWPIWQISQNWVPQTLDSKNPKMIEDINHHLRIVQTMQMYANMPNLRPFCRQVLSMKARRQANTGDQLWSQTMLS